MVPAEQIVRKLLRKSRCRRTERTHHSLARGNGACGSTDAECRIAASHHGGRSHYQRDACGSEDSSRVRRPVVWVKDASLNAGICARLFGKDGAAYEAELKRRYEQLRQKYHEQQARLGSLQEARENKLNLF